ncbi:MAG: GatB/YqeY domain-containing protein [Candidatus Puniceispirillales bacterium WSBS_2018_MAG_OTU23]
MVMRDAIQAALKDALKSQKTKELSTLRLISAALKDRDIAARSKGNMEGISDEDILSMLQTMIKQRQESSKMYRDGNREELAQSEEDEIVIIKTFLPEQMDNAAVGDAINTAIAEVAATSIKDMGKVMGFLKQNHAGQMDFGAASSLIKERLLG